MLAHLKIGYRPHWPPCSLSNGGWIARCKDISKGGPQVVDDMESPSPQQELLEEEKVVLKQSVFGGQTSTGASRNLPEYIINCLEIPSRSV